MTKIFSFLLIFLSIASTAILSMNPSENIHELSNGSLKDQPSYLEENKIFFTEDKFYDKGLHEAINFIYIKKNNHSSFGQNYLKQNLKQMIEGFSNYLQTDLEKHHEKIKLRIEFLNNEHNLISLENQTDELNKQYEDAICALQKGLEPANIIGKISEIKEQFSLLENSKDVEIVPAHLLAFGIALSALADIADGGVLMNTEGLYQDRFNYLKFLDMKIDLQNAYDFINYYRDFFYAIDSNETIDSLLPIYSKTGALGYNTIVHSSLEGYFLVGIGINHYPVHAGQYKNCRLAEINHDIVHGILRTKRLFDLSSKSLETYKNIYKKTLQNRPSNMLKDIYMLFFLCHELELNIENDNFEHKIRSLMPSDDKSNKFSFIKDRFIDKKYMILFNKYHNEICRTVIVDSIDMRSALKKFGFEIITCSQENPSLEEYYNYNESVQKALLELWQTFKKTYLDVK